MSLLSKPLVLGAIAASVIALCVAFRLQQSKQESKQSAAKDTSVVQKTENKEIVNADEPSLPKEQLLLVLEAISGQMGQIVVSLAQIEQKIRQESAQTGRDIPEDQLASYLMGQFEEAMKAIESQAYAKYNTTEELVQLATEYYQTINDQQVMEAVNKLQEVFRLMAGGEPTPMELPESLTLEKFMSVMEETMEAMSLTMEEVCLEVHAVDPVDKEAAINQRYVKRADEVTGRILEEHGFTRGDLQAGMAEYQADPIFISRMTEIQKSQTERFTAAISIFNGEVNMGL